MLSLQNKSALAQDRSNGFDYLRIILAVLIVAWHSVSISYGSSIEAQYFIPIRPMVLFMVPAFFALSGYLVAGSLYRTDHLPTFLTLRALRIFPALCCEVVISALIIGAALTTLPLKEYLTDRTLLRYFLNIFGYIHYFLPGVFADNISARVNNQLWTIPFELECYILIGVLYLATLHKKTTAFLGLLIAATITVTVVGLMQGTSPAGFQPSGRFAVASFLWGVLAYALREKIPHNRYIFVACIVYSWIMLQWREGEYLSAPAIAYVTVYIGLCDFRKTFVLWAGDISYGIYLYGFTIQQAVYQLTPPEFRSWAENFLVSIIIACGVGYLSWTYVESKVLMRKKAVVKFVRSLTDRFQPSRA